MPQHYSLSITDQEALIASRLLSEQSRQQSSTGNLCLYWFVFDDSPLTFSIPQTARFVFDPPVPVNTLDTLIAEIESVRNGPEGEQKPTDAAIDAALRVIGPTESLLNSLDLQIPAADLDFYYGELAVEWRKENRILRLTAFSVPDFAPRLDYGTLGTDAHPGEYHSDALATPELLAERLSWLSSGAPNIA